MTAPKGLFLVVATPAETRLAMALSSPEPRVVWLANANTFTGEGTEEMDDICGKGEKKGKEGRE